MDAPAPGGLGGTYAGNPLAVAAAHAVIEVMHEEKLPERGARLGAQLQARLVQAACGADQAPDPADADCDWLRAAVQRAYGLPVPAPQQALMPTLLPLRRQHMTARALHRGFFRQLLGLFVYRPAARLLRVFQVLTGRVERT
jgi:hypothetical protein